MCLVLQVHVKHGSLVAPRHEDMPVQASYLHIALVLLSPNHSLHVPYSLVIFQLSMNEGNDTLSGPSVV